MEYIRVTGMAWMFYVARMYGNDIIKKMLHSAAGKCGFNTVALKYNKKSWLSRVNGYSSYRDLQRKVLAHLGLSSQL